ncbi:putative ABC-type transport system, ATP binding component domain protein [Burkholderia mallei]|nr:putative ABC-type transport system, ATP binding component domain protein [Burkholderia mallei]
MRRRIRHVRRVARLDHAPLLHHAHPVRHHPHHRQVLRDEQVAEFVLFWRFVSRFSACFWIDTSSALAAARGSSSMSAASAARVSASIAFERTPGSFCEPVSDAAALPKRRTGATPGHRDGRIDERRLPYWKFVEALALLTCPLR